jgi:hypothetical protein
MEQIIMFFLADNFPILSNRYHIVSFQVIYQVTKEKWKKTKLNMQKTHKVLLIFKHVFFFILKKLVKLSNIIKPRVKKFHATNFFVKIVKRDHEM